MGYFREFRIFFVLTDLGKFKHFDDAALMFTVCRVEIVLDTVVAAPRQLLCDFSPLVAHLLVQVKDDPLFIDTDRVLHNLRVQVVMPSITFRRGGGQTPFFLSLN